MPIVALLFFWQMCLLKHNVSSAGNNDKNVLTPNNGWVTQSKTRTNSNWPWKRKRGAGLLQQWGLFCFSSGGDVSQVLAFSLLTLLQPEWSEITVGEKSTRHVSGCSGITAIHTSSSCQNWRLAERANCFYNWNQDLSRCSQGPLYRIVQSREVKICRLQTFKLNYTKHSFASSQDTVFFLFVLFLAYAPK